MSVAKQTYPLLLNNTNLVPDAYNNKFTYNFPVGSVQFKGSAMALAKVSLYYSWYNISSDLDNNTFSFTFTVLAGTTTYDVTIPDGFYDIASLNSFLQAFCITNGLYLVDSNGDNVYYLEFLENPTYYSIQVNCFPFPTALPVGYTNPSGITFPAVASTPQLIVPSTSFRELIGFSAGSYPSVIQASTQSFLSTQTPQVSPTQSVTMTCSLLNNKFSIPNTIFYSFTSSSTQFGSLIESEPSSYTFVPIQDGSYTSVTVEFLDQSFNKLKINDTNMVIQLLILD